jgi:hypothetical protein
MGNALDVAAHPLLRDLGPQADLHGVVGQGLDFLSEGVIEQGLHAGSSAHAAGVFQRDVFEFNSRGLFGHCSRSLSGWE